MGYFQSMYVLIFSLFFCLNLYAQCDDYSQSQCNNDNSCEWIEDVSFGSCYSLTVGQCYSYPDECYVDSNPGWYDSSGPYCTGGTYQIDNSFCQEIQMPECSEMTEIQCNISDDCDWLEDIINVSCINLPNLASCEFQMGCDWIEQTGYGNCSEFDQNSSACEATVGCYGAYQYPGWYSGWYCAGGTYQTNNSYCNGFYEVDNGDCVEQTFYLGDINGDEFINVIDVVALVSIVLDDLGYNSIADINYDNQIDILDIVALVSIVLNN